MSILLCHVVWMPFYRGEADVRAGGHDYVREEGYGHELLNFEPVAGTNYGYVQSRSLTINIDRLGADYDDTFVEGIDVIWTATPPKAKRVVVGWYRNARVYRDLQIGSVNGRATRGNKVGYYFTSESSNCCLIPLSERHWLVPYGGRGLPGQSSVFFPADSASPIMKDWLADSVDEMERYARLISSDAQKKVGSWPCSPDAAHNAAVEAAAIAFTQSVLGKLKRDRQKDNCGWDLEFDREGITLCVEVKGLSGATLAVELSPNEYAAMRRAVEGKFREGLYRLAIVRNALTRPEIFLFSHAGQTKWQCEFTGRNIATSEIIAARLA